MQKTFVFGVLTLALIGLILWQGLPMLVKIATFFSDIKSSKEIIKSEDETPPPPPKLQSLPEATSNSEITLRGFAESGSTVKIFLNGDLEKEIIADAEGQFVVESILLSSGKNRFQVQAVDQAGNESQKSNIASIDFDQTAPELSIEKPENNQSFSNDEKNIEIIGQTEPEITLTINDRLIILDNEGKFSFSLTLEQGENKVFIKAVDSANNITEKELILSFSSE